VIGAVRAHALGGSFTSIVLNAFPRFATSFTQAKRNLLTRKQDEAHLKALSLCRAQRQVGNAFMCEMNAMKLDAA
jgi:hypothetical protein